MARVIVDVMLKPEILDPQGRAVQGAFARLGVAGVHDIRQGKRFEITLDGDVTDGRLKELHQLAEDMLSNPVIENYTLRVES